MGLGTRRALWAYTFLLVPLLFFLTIRLAPAFSALYISLHEWNIISPSKPFVGLQNFRLLAHDPSFGRAAVNTLRYVLVAIPAQLSLGLVLAVPLPTPTLVFSAVYGTIVYLQLFTQVLNMTFGDQGGPLASTLTMVLYVYQLGFQRFKMGEAAAATAVLFAVILIITLLQMRVLAKPVEY